MRAKLLGVVVMVGSLIFALAPANANDEPVEMGVGKESSEILWVCADLNGGTGGWTCAPNRKIAYRSVLDW